MIGIVLSLKAALSMMLLRFVLLDGVIGDQEVVVEKFAKFFSELSSSCIDSDVSAARISEARIRSYYPAAFDPLSDDFSLKEVADAIKLLKNWQGFWL